MTEYETRPMTDEEADRLRWYLKGETDAKLDCVKRLLRQAVSITEDALDKKHSEPIRKAIWSAYEKVTDITDELRKEE